MVNCAISLAFYLDFSATFVNYCKLMNIKI